MKGTIEVSVNVSEPPASAGGSTPAIILDWRKIKDKENLSTVSNVFLNDKSATLAPPADAGGTDLRYEERNEHLIFTQGVKTGENVIKLDFTSPIATSGAAVTRYVDKEDGAEYIYSLFVPSDASTAFPVFDQPDLKARFSLIVNAPIDWKVVTNEPFYFLNSNYDVLPQNVRSINEFVKKTFEEDKAKNTNILSEEIFELSQKIPSVGTSTHYFYETKPISTYVFAFAAGEFVTFSEKVNNLIPQGFKPSKPKGIESQGDGKYIRKEC